MAVTRTNCDYIMFSSACIQVVHCVFVCALSSLHTMITVYVVHCVNSLHIWLNVEIGNVFNQTLNVVLPHCCIYPSWPELLTGVGLLYML